MRILLVHGDDAPWATHNRALEFQKRWTADEVTIAFHLRLPDTAPFDVIHFLYSGGIGIQRTFICANAGRVFTTLASQRTLDCCYDRMDDLIAIYRASRATVAQNPTLKRNLEALIGAEYAGKIHYIPNGVDERLFDRPFVVGYVATDQHGNHQYKGFHLVEQACRELGLDLRRTHNNYPRNVIPHDQMPDFYRQIDCLVLASEGEGCNNPTLEALAMNIPVISTRVGIAEELEGVTLVDRNVEAIKAALRKASGRIQILEKYTWATVAQQYHDLYQS